MSTLYHFRAKFSTRKRYFKPKSQKNVPANNCHLKVVSFSMPKVFLKPESLLKPCKRHDSMIYPINSRTHSNTVVESVYQISSANIEQNLFYKHLSSKPKWKHCRTLAVHCKKGKYQNSHIATYTQTYSHRPTCTHKSKHPSDVISHLWSVDALKQK